MKINWIRIVIAAVWSELLLFAIYVPTVKYAAVFPSYVLIPVLFLEFLMPMFLGGLWVGRTLESRFALHGTLVGIIANVVYFFLSPLVLAPLIPSPAQTPAAQAQPDQAGPSIGGLMLVAIPVLLKILACAAGAYAVGRRRGKTQSLQTAEAPS